MNQAVFLEAAGAVLKIGLSLKPNNIGIFSLPKSVKHSVVSINFSLFLFSVKSKQLMFSPSTYSPHLTAAVIHMVLAIYELLSGFVKPFFSPKTDR